MARKGETEFDVKAFQEAMRNAEQMATLAPVNLNSAEDIQERVDMYFNACLENCVSPDVAGLANALGVKRKELLQFGESGVNDPRVEVVAKALTRINAIISSLSKRLLINPTMTIMDLANDFGYSRQGDVVIERARDEKLQSAEQIAQKYAGLLLENNPIDVEIIEHKPRKERKPKEKHSD